MGSSRYVAVSISAVGYPMTPVHSQERPFDAVFLEIWHSYIQILSSLSLAFSTLHPQSLAIRLDQEAIGLATRYVHIVTDWLFLPVPLIVIFKLQMPLGKKFRLILVFCVGFISSLASIIRNILTVRLESRLNITYKSLAPCKRWKFRPNI